MPADRHPLNTAGRYALLAGVVAFLTVPVYVYLEPPWRPLVARLAASLVLGIALLELRGALAQRLARDERSPLDAARDRPAARPEIPARFLSLIADVRGAVRSQVHFEKVLWPRLTTLCQPPPVRPLARTLGRGPRLDRLRDVVTEIERQA
jgi:hypothetical protein